MRAPLPLAYGLALLGAGAAFLRWRWQWRAAAALIPVLAALTGLTSCWAAFDLQPEWLGIWLGGSALGYLALAEFDAPFSHNWRYAAAIAGLVALGWSHAAVFAPGGPKAQLPAAYGLLLLGAAWDRWRGGAEGGLLMPPLLTGLLTTVAWAAGVPERWWAFPAFGVAAGIVALELSRPEAATRSLRWSYVVVLAVVPTLVSLEVHHDHPAFGIASQLTTAALLLAGAWRARGAFLAPWLPTPTTAARTAERSTLVHAGYGFILAAAGSLNLLVGASGAERAWVFVAIASGTWVLLVAAATRGRTAIALLSPAALAAAIISGSLALPDPATATVAFAAAAAGALLVAFSARLWTLAAIASAFAQLALWSAWRWAEWDMALLPLAYVAAALGTWATLWRLRRYPSRLTEAGAGIDYLSWAPWALSALVAGGVLQHARLMLAPGVSLVRTEEWAMAALVLASVASAVVVEGWRMRSRFVWVPGTAGLLVAGLMTIATFEPSNVQAYTIPVGLYLVTLAFSWRRTPEFFGRHMAMHEALMVAGAVALVASPARAALAGTDARFGYELIALGAAFIAVGFTLHARWLVPAGVATFSGVALRWLTSGSTGVRYWLLLGIVGTALIGVAIVLLAQREQWDRLKARCARWWVEDATPAVG